MEPQGNLSLAVLWVRKAHLLRDTWKGLLTSSMVSKEKTMIKNLSEACYNYRLCNYLISLGDPFKILLYLHMFKMKMSRSGCGKQYSAVSAATYVHMTLTVMYSII